MDNIIEKYYEDFNFPSADKLYELMRKDQYEVTKKEIIEYLSKKQEVQQFKEVKASKKKQGHIISHSPNAIWQLDIYFLQKYYKHNYNYKYILACVDVFIRKAYAIPIKLKDNDEVYKGLKLLFKEAGTTPYIITSDSDSTFNSRECQKLFDENEIVHDNVPVGDHHSLGIIDRFARTLKTILHKRFVKYNSLNWFDALPKILENYNNSPHSSIDEIKPNDANKPENISSIIDINLKKQQEKTTFKNEFKEGDKVRIKIDGFNKKSEGQYSDEVYIVKETKGRSVILTNGKVKKYDMLLKVHDETPTETIKPKLIKKAKQEAKQEKILKRESIQEENIIRAPREKIRRDYNIYSKKGD